MCRHRGEVQGLLRSFTATPSPNDRDREDVDHQHDEDAEPHFGLGRTRGSIAPRQSIFAQNRVRHAPAPSATLAPLSPRVRPQIAQCFPDRLAEAGFGCAR